jgi:hypothetical protein
MSRIATGLFFTAVLFSAASDVQAGWFQSTYHDMKSAWHINNMWPQPYIAPDRRAVKEPIAIMQARGWQRYNLLGEHHFEEDQKRLTPAGHLKIKSILANSPAQYRTVYVEKGRTRAITDARIDAIQQAIVDMQTDGPLPPVLASDLIVEGWSSEYADGVNRRYYSSMPQPRLPSASGASSTSSGP